MSNKKKLTKSIEEKLDTLAEARKMLPGEQHKFDDFEVEQDVPEEAEVTEEAVTDEEPEIPFNGGCLIGALVNPSPEEALQADGYDQYGFSESRYFGTSLYEPLQQYCLKLMQSESAIMRVLGHRHLNDRFGLIRPDSAIPYSKAEKDLVLNGKYIGEQLKAKGAFGSLTFPPVEAMSVEGLKPVSNLYLVSAGFVPDMEVVELFISFMERHMSAWVMQDYAEVEALVDNIDNGLAAPVPGYLI